MMLRLAIIDLFFGGKTQGPAMRIDPTNALRRS
jgi:hypothetical protein